MKDFSKLPFTPEHSVDSPLLRDMLFVKTENGELYPFPLQFDDLIISADLGTFGRYTESLMPVKNGWRGEITLHVYTDDSFVVLCPFQLSRTSKSYLMIPGFLYGSNNLAHSNGTQPKFDYKGAIGWPNSSMFSIRADRSTHPGIITVQAGQVFLVGIDEKMNGFDIKQNDKWAPGYLYNGLLVDSSNSAFDQIGFTLGYEYRPARYSWQWDNPKTPRNSEYLWGGIAKCAGTTLQTRSFYVVDAADGIPDYGKALRAYYPHIHQAPTARATRLEALEKISQSILSDGYVADEKYFYQNDMPDGQLMGDIAWTGGMQVAYPLLKAGLKLNDKKAIDTAMDYMDHICTNAKNTDAGLLFEEYYKGQWNVTGWWGRREDSMNFGDKPLHSAYLNGQASYYLLKSCEHVQENKIWFETAKTVIETAKLGQRDDGAFPALFDPTNGRAVKYDMFQSCWFTPGVILLEKFTGEGTYLDSARRALDHYYSWHHKGELYGTPMDTHNAVDEEGNLAFIIACVEMHKLTKETRYLDYAMAGLNWEFSWKFAYNTANSNDPLKNLDWSSCGGSITSTFITTIHQMGNLVAGELYYLYTQLGDPYIASRLRDTCIWGLGTFNRFDNEFGFGKTGMATEQFFYTDGLCCPWWQPWDGGVWEANLPWAAACVLLSCAEDIPDEFFV